MQQSSDTEARTDVAQIDEAAGESADWLYDLEGRLKWRNRSKVFMALIATLHALRDALPVDDAIYLGAGFPALLRGFYYEGYHPREKPVSLEDRETFLTRVHEGLHRDPGIDTEATVRAVFKLLAERLSAPELEDVKAACPMVLHGLWPT